MTKTTLERIEDLIRQGYPKAIISRKVKNFSDESFSIAKARIKNNKENKINPHFLFNEEDLRFCTNQFIAEYRANRLKCRTIIDIGCGVGIQALEFAKTCREIHAIELDKRKIEYAKINAKLENLDNINFINDDALNALGKLKKADVIFWDPERPSNEKERILESLEPNFEKVLEKARKLTENISIELPPHLDRSKLKQDCEFEYISINGKLNRLNIYFGKLRKCDVSVVSLPSKERLEYSKGKIPEPSLVKKPKTYLYEVDNSLLVSGLIDLFISKQEDADLIDIGKYYITSDKVIKSNFLKAYEVIGCEKQSDLVYFLNKRHFKRVILHGKIDEKEYVRLTRNIETQLTGSRTAHVFLNVDEAIVAEKVQ